MKRSLLKHASLGARSLLLSPSTYRPSPSSSLAPLAASTQFRVDLHSFESVSSNKSNLTQTQKMVFSTDVEDVSDQELKNRIEKFYAGDAEAVPSIFEAILKRKLAGKDDEAEKKLMEQICGKRGKPLEDDDDEEFDSDEEFGSDEDSDEGFGSDPDESLSQIDEDFDGKKIGKMRRARDE
ncbi:hypothetical protein FH972_019731 [Carpinus fangiana]|uniref:Uncharacterized protein n=1 Tax=Carpinus fangiana TaxID=176857 RepID=A0A5N6RR10_9ROSI|nr:hypothetical protein FH972_019731 [Carpinus fangiana]